MRLYTAILSLTVGLTLAVGAARADDNGLGKQPYMGWSSWSLQATHYPGYGGGDHWKDWLTADHLKAQSDVLHTLLQKHGYRYLNVDSGWQGSYDAFGRPIPDTTRFPKGMADLARYVHHNGQKLGIYWIPGINGDLYKLNPPILGTPYHIQDIVRLPLHVANGWGGGDQIDYSKPGAQAYIDSCAALFASWGVDFLKFDGVTPGSDDNDLKIDARPDVQAWASALKRTGRPIWLELSWNLDRDYAPYWQKYANGRRITDDVDTYGPTLTAWYAVKRAFPAARDWASDAGPNLGWNDLDSLDIGDGTMDGLNLNERQAMMTLWAICCSPLYTGDDLTKLDPQGMAFLTNDEVIAVDQAGHPAAQIVGGAQQIWAAPANGGGEIVALFNMDDTATVPVTVAWSQVGLHGPARVRDLWAHTDLGRFSDQYTVSLPPHGAALLRLKPTK
jgi:hypothetical protein